MGAIISTSLPIPCVGCQSQLCVTWRDQLENINPTIFEQGVGILELRPMPTKPKASTEAGDVG
jgi:hypothetical protein